MAYLVGRAEHAIPGLPVCVNPACVRDGFRQAGVTIESLPPSAAIPGLTDADLRLSYHRFSALAVGAASQAALASLKELYLTSWTSTT